MSDVWVVDASPVIVLAKAGHATLLEQLCSEVVFPEAVVAEVLAGPAGDPARQLLEIGQFRRAAPDSIPDALLEWGLGPGETSVLALTLERMPATAILDDGAARACAKALGVPCMGTLGIILRAKRLGCIHAAADALLMLRDAGLYLDDDTAQAALGHAGEDWPR